MYPLLLILFTIAFVFIVTTMYTELNTMLALGLPAITYLQAYLLIIFGGLFKFYFKTNEELHSFYKESLKLTPKDKLFAMFLRFAGIGLMFLIYKITYIFAFPAV